MDDLNALLQRVFFQEVNYFSLKKVIGFHGRRKNNTFILRQKTVICTKMYSLISKKS